MYQEKKGWTKNKAELKLRYPKEWDKPFTELARKRGLSKSELIRQAMLLILNQGQPVTQWERIQQLSQEMLQIAHEASAKEGK